MWGTCLSSQVEKHQNDSTALWRLSPGTTGFASAKGNAFEAFLNVSLQTGNGRDYLINEKKIGSTDEKL